METSIEILIVAGVLSLAYAFLLGIALAQARMAAPQAPRHLVTTHLEALILGAVLLGLTVAVELSRLPRGWETAAASLVVGGGATSLLGGTANWQQKVGDQFAARSPGFVLQAASAPLSVAGIALVVVGVFKGL